MNADVLWALAISGILNFIALTFLAIRLRAPISITVQSPNAILPERLMATLDAIDAKLQPARITVDESQLSSLVYEGVALAECSKLKGADRFRIAKDFMLSRLNAMNANVDERDIALRIEAAVAVNKSVR